MQRKTEGKNNYAFIDSQNLNLGTQKVGWKMDWARFRRWLGEEYGVSNAYLFIGYLPEYQAMYEQMHELGYRIVLKPTVGMLDEKKPEEDGKNLETKKPEADKESEDKKPSAAEAKEAKPAVKGNIDAELVMYAMKEMPNYDKAVIVSGDGDFYCLVEYLAEKNKLLHLMAPNWQYSSLLKPYEQYIVRLDKERRTLAYHTRRKPTKLKH